MTNGSQLRIDGLFMLNIENLRIDIDGENIVRDISFSVEKGEILGLVGESGSGKTMTMLGVAGLIKDDAQISGNIMIDGINLCGLSSKERRKYNGKDISYIFQEPMTSLNPLMKVGEQIEEILVIHTDMDKESRKKEINEMLELMEFECPEEIYDKYPHELSGGMRQRVVIAMASILKPALIIADEPTTALDVETGEAVLHIIKKINEKFKSMIILISHDLKVIKKMCGRVVVMKSGEIVEVGNTSDIFANPKDDYTKRLIASIQTYEKANKKTENKPLVEIDNLSLFYNEKKGDSIFAKTEKHYIAEGICFTINKGEILGLLGGSGCGKSTLSRVLAGLKHNYEGNIRYIGENKEDKINIKMVFQDPYSSLNPSMTIGEIISEPLRNQKKSSVKHTKEDIRQQVEVVLELIGLDKEYYNRYPSELSGGQRQRVSIGAAIISKPQLIIADEPVSALDATICQQILELFVDIQKKYETTILMISHDVSVLEKTCDRIIKWENIKN